MSIELKHLTKNLNLYLITYHYNYKDHIAYVPAKDFGPAQEKFNKHFTVRKPRKIELVAESMKDHDYSGFLC